MGYYAWGPFGVMGIGMGLLGLLSWGLIIALVVVAVRALVRGDRAAAGSGAAPAPTPLDILKMRYARGEIDRAEFEERKQTLSS